MLASSRQDTGGPARCACPQDSPVPCGWAPWQAWRLRGGAVQTRHHGVSAVSRAQQRWREERRGFLTQGLRKTDAREEMAWQAGACAGPRQPLPTC